MRRRLAALFFLVFAPLGAVLPFYSLWLQRLGFSPQRIAVVCCTQALGSMFAPFAGQVADRWFRADRCLAVCALAGGGLLWFLSRQTDLSAVFAVSLLFWIVYAPVVSLSATISFTHLRYPEREFGPVRLWGTVGWVGQCWLVGWWLSQFSEASFSDALRLAAVMMGVLGLYALKLPHTPPRRGNVTARLAPLAALRLLRRPAFAIYFACNLAVYVTVPFSQQNTSLLLTQRGVSDQALGPILTIAQSTEIASLLLLPPVLARWGSRRLMIAGIAAWAAAMTVLSLGAPTGLAIASLMLNGVFVCWFLVVGQMYVNSQAASDFRASAQTMFSFMNGVGLLAGNWLAGWVRERAGGEFEPTFAVAAVIAATATAALALGFHHDEAQSGESSIRG